MFKEPVFPAKIDSESMIENLMKIEGLDSIIPEDHLEFFKSVIYKKITEHVPKILSQKNWAGELSEEDLNHVHIFIQGEYGNIKDVEKIREKIDDISYLYHSKELKGDATNRNIFIDNHGRFEALDDDHDGESLGTEGREIVAVFFSDSFEKMKEWIEENKGYLDKKSIAKVGDLFFASSSRNYR
jgi:hypothetical protein